MRTWWTLLAGLAVVVLSAATAFLINKDRPPTPQKTTVRGHTMYTWFEPGEVPAVMQPDFVTVSEAGGTYRDQEPLMAVTNGTTAKGYSTWYLDRYRIINDFVNGYPIAVTWSPSSHTGIVYAAEPAEKRLTFQASGSLWRGVMVMQDLETRSLWSQMTGEAIAGPMEGTVLKLYPAMHTTFGEFRLIFRNGLLPHKPLSDEAAVVRVTPAIVTVGTGVAGRAERHERLGARDIVYGLRLKGRAAAVAQEFLRHHHFAMLQLPHPVVVTFDSLTSTAAAYSFGDTITIEKYRLDVISRVMELRPSGSDQSPWRWHSRTGRSLIAGMPDLRRVPLIESYWFAWKEFYPESELIK